MKDADDPKQAGERILQIAKEVGAGYSIDAEHGTRITDFSLEALAAFASRIRADEREECARVCEISNSHLLLSTGEMTAQELRTARAVLKGRASAIRSRK